MPAPAAKTPAWAPQDGRRNREASIHINMPPTPARPSMTIKKGASKHVFGRLRPSATGKHPIQLQPPRDTKFRPLPSPTGQPPFRLDLKSILAPGDYAAIVKNKKLVFHLNGDMGGIMYAVPQELVAKGMETDCSVKAPAGDTPAFLYTTAGVAFFKR